MLPKEFRWSILGCILGISLSLIPAVSSSTCPAPLVLQLTNCTIAGTSVHSWGLKLDLADPSQSLCVVPSTVVNSTLVISSDFCLTNPNLTTTQCESLCGNTFNSSAAGSSFTSTSASAVSAHNPVWGDISPDPLLAGTTELQLPPSSSSANNDLPKYPIGIITSGNHQNVGHLGLANNSDFLHSAFSNGAIPANGFGLNAGSQSVANPRDGSLVLGGYDLGCIDGPFYNSTITGTSSSERGCPLQVVITELVLRLPLEDNFTDIALTSFGVNVPACIEPYDNLFRLPLSLLKSFKDATGWSANTTADADLYVVEPGLYYPQTKGFNGSLIIRLSNGFEAEIPTEELSHPLRGINANGARVLTQQGITEVNIFSLNVLNTAVLGKVFLSQAYLTVDYPMNQFRLARMVTGNINSNPVHFNATSGDTCPSASTGKSGWSSRDTKILVGCLVPGLFVVCFIGLFILFRRRRADQRKENTSNNHLPPVVPGQEQLPKEQLQQTTAAPPPEEEEFEDADLRDLPEMSDSSVHSTHIRDG